MTLAEIEKKAIYSAIKRHGGDKVSAAKELGIGKTTIYPKLTEYSRKKPKKKAAKKKKKKKGQSA